MRRLLTLCALALWAATAVAEPFEPVTAVAPDRPVPMIMNLSHVTDWSTQQPFIDRMKAARPWLGHKPQQWGGVEAEELWARGVLDPDGWPTRIPDDLASIGTLIMTDLPPEAHTLSGRYVLRFDGSGIVEVSGRATQVRYGPNEVRFDFTPGQGGVVIKIQRTGPGDDYLRNITVIREDRLEAYQAGAVFNPDFVNVVAGFQGLRFMDWMATNHATRRHWEERPKPSDYSYMHRGIPLEVMVALANTLGADPWFTLPHRADDDYMRRFAETVERTLAPGLTSYAEYSNEVWNWSFAQARWADEQARARWGRGDLWMQFYGLRAAEMAKIWRQVFAATPHRLKTVISSQTGWPGLETQALHAPEWQAEGNPPPYQFFDAYAVTGYFGRILGTQERRQMTRDWIRQSTEAAAQQATDAGLSGSDHDAYVARHRYDLAFALAGADLLDGRISGNENDTLNHLFTRVLPYQADVARDHDLELIMYEGGTHVVGIGPVVDDAEIDAFFRAFNYSTEMGALYTQLFRAWSDLTDGPFAPFNDVAQPSKWGSWGALRHLGDENPRWDALLQFRKAPYADIEARGDAEALSDG